ncbi:hypothetical protein ACFSX8_06330 [Acinetobacter gyllenbergii]|uniref:hypothetical protein n=1 Tax=Acinetobacter gyllenbergii TaxID=134534 RepID=UPI000352850D|nr:hypothetical protein [Acinetobacter gyllenbergii]EPH31216.1 hypothetical protein L293_2366 [Acinetobacter gyllenbergii CIP 110306 = MTCC 11365]
MNKNEDLKNIFYGDLYKNKKINIANIETIILAIIFVNTIFWFSYKNLKIFLKKGGYSMA